MPPFKDEHVLIIAPGSNTTLTQLGLPESFTPARWRFPTRMFPSEKNGEWEPTRILTKTVTAPIKAEEVKIESTTYGDHALSQLDTEMKDAPNPEGDAALSTDPPAVQPPEEESLTVYEDDPLSIAGAVYPIREGRIENWSCLFALFIHIYNTLAPPFAYISPVLVVAQPCWSARDHEILTQFFFENFKIPAFCIMDAALTACYAYGQNTATVVDVGHDKCDVTAVTDFIVNDYGRGVAIKGCGGRGFTQRLQQVLQKQGFNEDMAEQLKRNPVCEILPLGTALPQSMQNGEQPPNPAAAASTGALDSGFNAKDADGLRPGQAPRGPGMGTVGEEGANGDEEDNEGVLDVASIVAKENAAEILARREREKAEKAAAKKGGVIDQSKQVRLKNSEKEKVTFIVEEIVPDETMTNGDGHAPSRKRKREVEVGVERFMASTPPDGFNDGIVDTIAASIHNTILTHPDPSQRSALWDNLIITGNGSRIKGFTAALLSTLAARYTLSPSTATIFTSELPSNFSTPLPTNGTNTPIPGLAPHPTHHPAAHGVNPLLVAATSRTMQPSSHLQVPHLTPDSHLLSHKSHSQTPTSIRTVKVPDYFPEWKDPSVSGMEEAGFLGAQVAAKVIFIVDQGLSKGFLTRVEFNDLGPVGIHDCAM